MSCEKNVGSAALLQLGTFSKVDAFTKLNGAQSDMVNPFIPAWRRHVNFALAQVEFSPNEPVSNLTTWGDDKVICARMPLCGSMIIQTYVRAKLGALSIPYDTIDRADDNSGAKDAKLYPGDAELTLHWCEEVGHAMFQHADLLVDSSTIDSVTDVHMHAYHQTISEAGQLLNDSIGRRRLDQVNSLPSNTPELETFSAIDRQLYVPLPFLYSMQSPLLLPSSTGPTANGNIEVKLQLRARQKLIVALDTSSGADLDSGATKITSSVTGGALLELAFVNDVVFLDTAEHERLYGSCVRGSQPSLQYYEYSQPLYEKPVAAGSTSVQIENLNLRQAVTSIFAMFRPDTAIAEGKYNYFDFSVPLSTYQRPKRWSATGTAVAGLTAYIDPIATIEYSLDGAPRFSRHGVYAHESQARKHMKRIPTSFIHVHSHALDASDRHEPSGSVDVDAHRRCPMTVTFTDVVQTVAEDISGPYVAPAHVGVPAGKLFVFGRAQGLLEYGGGRGIRPYWTL